jgi:FMN phosphatase YigB (HAD superfamily)
MIRLVIFDFGDTFFHAEPDGRFAGSGRWDVLDRDDHGWPTVLAPPDTGKSSTGCEAI